MWDFPVVYWLRLSTSTAGGVGSMFNITIREMQIKTQVPSHIDQNGHRLSLQIINARASVGGRKKEPSPTFVGGNVNWYCHYRKQ